RVVNDDKHKCPADRLPPKRLQPQRRERLLLPEQDDRDNRGCEDPEKTLNDERRLKARRVAEKPRCRAEEQRGASPSDREAGEGRSGLALVCHQRALNWPRFSTKTTPVCMQFVIHASRRPGSAASAPKNCTSLVLGAGTPSAGWPLSVRTV